MAPDPIPPAQTAMMAETEATLQGMADAAMRNTDARHGPRAVPHLPAGPIADRVRRIADTAAELEHQIGKLPAGTARDMAQARAREAAMWAAEALRGA